jgi:hypothetical protein
MIIIKGSRRVIYLFVVVEAWSVSFEESETTILASESSQFHPWSKGFN